MGDAELVGHLGGSRVDEAQQAVDGLQAVVRADRLIPGPADPTVPEPRRFLGRVVALEPWLAHHEHAIRMGLRPADEAMEMALEMVQHDGGVRHRGSHLFRLRAHSPRGGVPRPGALPDL